MASLTLQNLHDSLFRIKGRVTLVDTMPTYKIFFTIIALLNLASSVYGSSSPLFPEDGSSVVRKWYYSESNRHFKDPIRWKKIEAIARTHKFQLMNIGPFHEWVQDVLLFDTKGSFVAQAPYPFIPGGESDLTADLTFGVANEDQLLRVTTDYAQTYWKLKTSEMATTFIEGGGLITGVNRDQLPYAIITTDVLGRARAFIKYRDGADPGVEKAKALVALDLKVDLERLYVVDSSSHIDLLMFPLPNGKILLNDPRKVSAALKSLTSKATEIEKIILDRMISFYEKGHARSGQFPYHQTDLNTLDKIELALEKDFEVIRVAGVFNDWETGSYLKDDRINFFNGTQGLDPEGTHWVMTNEAKNLKILENYWAEIIRQHSTHREVEVYFPGIYSSGAGLDCSGALSY